METTIMENQMEKMQALLSSRRGGLWLFASKVESCRGGPVTSVVTSVCRLQAA